MSPLRTLIFAAEEGHSWASIRGAVLKQPMGRLDQLGIGRSLVDGDFGSRIL